MEIEDLENMKKITKSPKFKVRLTALIILIVLLFGFGVYLLIDYFNLDSLQKVWSDLGFDKNEVVDEYEVIDEYETEPEAVSLDEVEFLGGDIEVIEKDNEVVDILLIGVDNRDSEKFTGRSDVLMVLRIDKSSGEIKLASFMRDTLVAIEGHNKNRINTAYRFGSTDLIYLTMEQNYGIVPDYYMVVNFFGMEDIIDAMDGVDIKLQSKELYFMNLSIDEVNTLDRSGEVSHVKSSGLQHLNGRQAVAYMRIRKLGGDAERVGRQQTVLNALFEKATTLSVGQLPDLIEALSQYVRTDIPLTKMISIGASIIDMDSSALKKFTYPQDYKSRNYKDMAIVLPVNLEEEILKLKDFLEN